MDIGKQIDQLNDQITNLENSLKTLGEQLKKAKAKLRGFQKLEEKAIEINREFKEDVK